MLKAAISGHANARPPRRRRWALPAAGVVALFGSLAVTAPAQAGYYGDYGYGYRPGCSYGCGYRPYHYGCSACGCYRHCYSGSRGYVYERRYIEREYVERRFGCCHRHYGDYPYGGYRHYGDYPYGGYRHYGDYPYEGYRRRFPYGGYDGPFPYGYGGVRYWRPPSGYYRSADVIEDAPRPPAPILGEDDY
jgi:hypothetical protein